MSVAYEEAFPNNIRVRIFDNYDTLSDYAAQTFFDRATRISRLQILNPTGTTPRGFYERVAAEPGRSRGAIFNNYDEFVVPNGRGGWQLIDRLDPASYRGEMDDHLYDSPAISIESHFPGIENVAKPGSYDRKIAGRGPIHLAIHAFGEDDGHAFGFNLRPEEPVSALEFFRSVTRLVRVNKGTQEVNQRLTGLETPDYALTTGIATGMAALEVLTLAAGARKAEMLHRIIWDDISPEVPATILRTHPNHTFVVTTDAAAKL